MQIKKLLWLTVILAAFFSCKKDENGPDDVTIALSFEKDTVIGLNASVTITAIPSGNAQITHQWKVNDSIYATTAALVFRAPGAGVYMITYTGKIAERSYTHFLKVTVAPRIRPVTGSSSRFINKIFTYAPAPGQFINESAGTADGAATIIGGRSGLVSLGAYGGYIVFGFDHSVVNKAGADLALYGNPLPAPRAWSEPGIVMVSQDINENGLPDDPWYELAGSEYSKPAVTIRNYRIVYYNPKATAGVTWKDNQGRNGAVEINAAHNHSYYPSFAANQDSLVFEGTLLPSTFTLQDGIYVNQPFAWGYADNYATDAQKDPYATNTYNAFDLSWAVNEDGNPVVLPAIDFVKVYTGQNEKGYNIMGEVSTEISGASDLNMK
ncbi:PKD domain-containing protein [Chitinophaga agri]|uniref:PKD domain-containing protein n=1 Tax=Chitinophaga agri TaxID=2703787 RepID=A0A6B9Z9N8_9BACT|nr:PKD domain-containing protein [Chitinophaga agri]QHS58767.1 PKD domain-containing protein [Chitinophaga agri]